MQTEISACSIFHTFFSQSSDLCDSSRQTSSIYRSSNSRNTQDPRKQRLWRQKAAFRGREAAAGGCPAVAPATLVETVPSSPIIFATEAAEPLALPASLQMCFQPPLPLIPRQSPLLRGFISFPAGRFGCSNTAEDPLI